MEKRISYIGILIVIPILAILVAFFCELKLNAEIAKSLSANSITLTSEEIHQLTARKIISLSNTSELKDIRSQIVFFDYMNIASITILIVSFIFSILLWGIGKIASVNRDFLLFFFTPAFFLSTLIFIIVTLVNASLLVLSIYYGESYLFNRVHTGIITLIGIGACIGVGIIIKALFSSLIRSSTFVIGEPITDDKYPRIWSLVRTLAERMNALPPQNIVVGCEPNFFVTEVNVICPNQKLKGRTLFLSLSLGRLITLTELQAIIAHELSHFKGKDTKYSKRFYPIYRGLINSLNGLDNSMEGVMAIAVLPTQLMLASFLEYFSAAERKLSRDRELIADKEACDVTSRISFSKALLKVIVFGAYWEKVEKTTIRSLKKGELCDNTSQLFHNIIQNNISDEMFDGVFDQTIFHPTDSHPTLKQRLDALEMNYEAIQEEVKILDNDDSAILAFDNADELEKIVSNQYHSLLIKFNNIEIPENGEKENN